MHSLWSTLYFSSVDSEHFASRLHTFLQRALRGAEHATVAMPKSKTPVRTNLIGVMLARITYQRHLPSPGVVDQVHVMLSYIPRVLSYFTPSAFLKILSLKWVRTLIRVPNLV